MLYSTNELHTKNLNTVSSNLLLVKKGMICSYGRIGVCSTERDTKSTGRQDPSAEISDNVPRRLKGDLDNALRDPRNVHLGIQL